MIMLDKCLNLEGIVIEGYKQLENIGIVFKVQSQKRQAICPNCAKISKKLHQNHWHLVKDLPMSGQEVYLKINLRQFKCNNCQKPFSEKLDFVEEKRTYTIILAMNILKQLKDGDILSVSKRNGEKARRNSKNVRRCCIRNN